jgi:hypothetical protein
MHDTKTTEGLAGTLPPGIRRRGQRWQVFAKIHGRFVSRYLSLDTSLETLTLARATMIAEAPSSAPVAPGRQPVRHVRRRRRAYSPSSRT